MLWNFGRGRELRNRIFRLLTGHHHA